MDSQDEKLIFARMTKSMERIRKAGTFECASCQKRQDVAKLESMGVYFPNKMIQTVAGPKARVVVYPVCSVCMTMPIEALGQKVERNLTCLGAMLDPEYHAPEGAL